MADPVDEDAHAIPIIDLTDDRSRSAVDPDFEAYPVELTLGPRAEAIDLSSHPEAEHFFTALSTALSDAPNFADHYGIAMVGCGTMCQSLFMVDHHDGSVMVIPVTASAGAEHRLESNLIIVNPPSEVQAMLDPDDPDRWLYSFAFLWNETDRVFELIWTDDPDGVPVDEL